MMDTVVVAKGVIGAVSAQLVISYATALFKLFAAVFVTFCQPSVC